MSWKELPQSEYKITIFSWISPMFEPILHFAHVNYPIITQFNKGILDIDENNPPKCSFTVFCTAIGSRSTKILKFNSTEQFLD